MTRIRQPVLRLSLSLLIAVSVVAPVAGLGVTGVSASDESASAAGTSGTGAVGPDLTVTNVTWEPHRFDLEEEVTFSATVENTGGANVSGPFSVSFSIDDGTVTFVRHRGTLAPNETVTLNATAVVETAGQNLTATVDSFDQVAETDETNNSLTAALPPIDGPDLVVSDLTLGATDYTPGEPVTVSVNVTNAGSAAVTDDSIGVDLFTSTETGDLPTEFGVGPSELGANETVTIPVEWTAQGGNVSLTAEATLSGPELNDSNNGASLDPPFVEPPDFTVTDITLPSNYTAGEDITVTATVRNEGPGDFDGTLETEFYYNETTFIDSNSSAVDLPAGTERNVTVRWTDAQAGNFSLGVAADGRSTFFDRTGSVNEADETNNERVESVSGPPAPDLAVTDLSWPSNYTAGEDITLTATVRNQGPGDFSGSLETAFYYDGTNRIGSNFSTVDLAAGTETDVTVRWFGASTGDFEFRVVADERDDINEVDETDNEFTVSRAGSRPDLTVADISWPSDYAAGETVTLTATVRNEGPGHFDGSLDTDFYYDGTEFIDSNSSSIDLAAGTETDVTVRWNTAQAGDFELRAVVDEFDDIDETNETNNQRVETVSRPAPDLAVADISWPSNYTAGETITLTATVRNDGPGDFNGSTDTVFYADNTSVGANVSVVDLPSGTERNVTVRWGTAQAGDFEFRVVADEADIIDEADETNNERVEAASVPAPDITVTDLSWPSNYTAGEDITLTATVRNDGPGDFSGSLDTGFYYNGTNRIGSNFSTVDLAAGTETDVTVRWFGASTGDFDFRVVVDEIDIIDEADETNNEFTVPRVGSRPDLTVADIGWHPREYAAGESVVLVATVENVGTGTFDGSTDTAFYANDTRVGTALDVVRIEPGERATVNATWVDAEAGVHRLRAVADDRDRVLEANESNNEYAVRVSRPRADLVVTDISWPSTDDVRTGEAVPLTVTVRNDGADLVRCFETEVRVDGTALGRQERCGLDAGASVELSVPWNAASGNHTLEAVADVRNTTHESNESNNDRTETLVLTLTPPDLVVTGVRTSPTDPVDGETVTVSATVTNRGPGSLADLSIPVALLVNGTRVDRDEVLAGLPAGRSGTVSLKWSASSGNHTLRVVADPGDRIGEADETDNAAEVTREYRLRRPDLTIADVRVADADPTVGQRVRLYANVTNLGGTTRRCVEVDFTANGRALGTVRQNVACGIQSNLTLVSFHPWSATVDTNDLSAEVDPDDTVPETDESNNTATTQVSVARPDLAVTNVSITPDTGVQPGDDVRITAEVTNVGRGGLSGPIDLLVTVRNGSDGPVLGRISRRLGGGLAAGETRSTTATWEATPGTDVSVRVAVDPWDVSSVPESDESNNSLTAPTTLDVASPDLRVSDIAYSPSTDLTDEENVTFDITVENVGAGRATGTTLRLAVGGDRISVPVPAIAGGSSETVTAVWRARVGSDVPVSATVDPDNRLAEADETNNARDADSIPAVSPLERFFPAVVPDERTLPPGTEERYAVTIDNNGSADAAYEIDVSGIDDSWYRLDTDEVFLGAGERTEVPLTVTPPADCSLNATHAIEATVSSLDTGATKRSSAELRVDPRPTVLDVRPTNGSEVGTTAPTVTWRTRSNTTGRVYVREVGASDWSVFEGSNATLHAVQLADLSQETWYEFRVESANDCATTTSETRRVFVDDGVFFTEAESSVEVERDYNQKHVFHVKNTDDEAHDVVVNVRNPYDDVILGFVGAGSVDEPLTLEPGERAPVGLRIHTQDASRERYDLVANLTTVEETTTTRTSTTVTGSGSAADAVGSGSIGTAHAAVRVNVDVPEFNLSVTRVSSDDATLARTYRVTNHGDTLTDFAVTAIGSNKTRVLFDPAFSHGLLRSGESVTFVARPLLHEGGSGFNATLRFGAAGQHVDRTVDFRAPAGEKVFTARYPPTEVAFGSEFDGDGSNTTNPANGSTVAPVLANGTPVFLGRVQVRVRQRGVTVAGEDVSLVLSDGSERTVVDGETDLGGRATFRITLSPGTYTYRVVVDGMGAITEAREFTVNDTAGMAYDIGVEWERIADENSTYDGTTDNVTLDNATYRVEASAPRAPPGAAPVLVLQSDLVPQWIQTIQGTLDGDTVRFNASAIGPGDYTARITVRSESRVLLSPPRNLTVTDTNPRNFENQTVSPALDPDGDLEMNRQLIETEVEYRDAPGMRKSVRFLDVESCACRPVPAEFRPNVSSTDPTDFEFQYRYVYAITANETLNDTLIVKLRDENGNLTYHRRQDFTVGPNSSFVFAVPVSVENAGTPLQPSLPEGGIEGGNFTIEIVTVDEGVFETGIIRAGEALGSRFAGKVVANVAHCGVGFTPAGKVTKFKKLATAAQGLSTTWSGVDAAKSAYDFMTSPSGDNAGSAMEGQAKLVLSAGEDHLRQVDETVKGAPGIDPGSVLTSGQRVARAAAKIVPVYDCYRDAREIYQAWNNGTDDGGDGNNGTDDGDDGDRGNESVDNESVNAPGAITIQTNEDWRCTNRPLVTSPFQGPSGGGTGGSGSGTAASVAALSDGPSTSAAVGTDRLTARLTERETAADIANASTDGIEAITFENRFGEFGVRRSLGPFDTIYRWNGERIGALTNEIPVGPYQFRIDDPRPGFVRRSGEGGTATNHFTIVTRGMNPGHYAQNTETTVNFFLERRTMRVVARNRTEADRLFAEHVNETTAERRPDAVIPQRDLVVSDTDPEPGDTVTVSATVHNFGTDYVSKAQVRFLVDGTEIVETPVYFMRPGATRTREVEYTVPASDPGTLNVTAVVDPDDRMTEEDETNNAANGTISVGTSGLTATFGLTTATPTVGQTVRFDASASTAPGGTIVSYAWDFDGDGVTDANGVAVSHAFDVAADHPVTLTVTDGNGTSVRTTRTVTVRLPSGVDAFGDTTAPDASRTTPPELADRLRVESSVAANASIERTANRSGNYSLSIDVTGNASDVTFYLNASRLERALGGLDDARLLVDGRERPFWVARADGGRWVAFVVEEFSTRRVTFTTSCIGGVVAGDDRTVSLAEIQRAIDWWAEDTPVPDTGGERIGLTRIQGLIDAWATDATVSCGVGTATTGTTTTGASAVDGLDADANVSATRRVEAGVPGEVVDVSVRVHARSPLNGPALDESVPSDLNVTRQTTDPDGHYRPSEHQWLWLRAESGDTMTVNYSVAVPDDAAVGQVYELNGSVSAADEGPVTVEGDTAIRVVSPTPTPTPGNGSGGGDGGDGGSGGGGGGQPGGGASGEVEITGRTLLNDTVTTGEPVVARADLANFDPARGRIALTLTADGSTVADRTVGVRASSRRTVDLSTRFGSPGTYSLSLNGQSIGEVTVEATATPTATRTPTATMVPGTPTRVDTATPTPTSSPTPTPESAAEPGESPESPTTSGDGPGLGLLVAVLALGLALLGARRRT